MMKTILSRFGVFQTPNQMRAEPARSEDTATTSGAPIQRTATYPK